MDKISDLPSRLSELLAESMSATQLAEIIGMSKQTISAYTTGARSPKRPAINAMADALGVNPLWLMGYDVPKFPSSTSSTSKCVSLELTAEETDLIHKYRALDERGRSNVRAVLDNEYNLARPQANLLSGPA